MLLHRPTFGCVILAELALGTMSLDSVLEILIIGCHLVITYKVLS